MGEAEQFGFRAIIGRTLRMAVQHALVFLALAIVAYAAARASALVTARLLPIPEAWPPGIDPFWAALERTVLARLLQIPAAVVALLAAAMMVHRAWMSCEGRPSTLRVDAEAAGRAFWALAAIATVWVVLNLLPWLPDWFRAPPLPASWYWDAGWLPVMVKFLIYQYVQWHPFIAIGSVALLVLGVLWCVAIPAAVIERLGPVAAFRRSLALTRGRRWQILGLWLIYAALGAGLILGAEALQKLAIAQAWSWKPIPTFGAARWMLGSIVMAVGTAAIYAELRRSEAASPPADATTPHTIAAPSPHS